MSDMILAEGVPGLYARRKYAYTYIQPTTTNTDFICTAGSRKKQKKKKKKKKKNKQLSGK